MFIRLNRNPISPPSGEVCHVSLISSVLFRPSEINNGVGSTDELSVYTGNGLDAYTHDDIMTPARHAAKL